MNAPLALQDFQRAFGQRIRSPRAPLPVGLPRRPMAAYEELLFNNLRGFLDRCFPVGRACLGEVRWRGLCRAFFRDWPCQSALFRDIPWEFTAYLSGGQAPRLPRWFAELARYEWAELAVDVCEAELPVFTADADLYAGCPRLNPTLMLLNCQWPVHEISPEHRPRRPRAVQLAVFRDASDQVRFAQLTPATARLLALLRQEAPLRGEDAINRLLAEWQQAPSAALLAFGRQCLQDLQTQGMLCGVRDED